MKRVPLNKKSDYIALEALISDRLSGPVSGVRFTYPRTLILSFGDIDDPAWPFRERELNVSDRWTLTFKDGMCVSYDADDWSQTEADVLPTAKLLEGASVTAVKVHRKRLDLRITFDGGAEMLARADIALYSAKQVRDDKYSHCFSLYDLADRQEMWIGPRLDYRIFEPDWHSDSAWDSA